MLRMNHQHPQQHSPDHSCTNSNPHHTVYPPHSAHSNTPQTDRPPLATTFESHGRSTQSLEEKWRSDQQKRQQEALEWQCRMQKLSLSQPNGQPQTDRSIPVDELNSRFRRLQVQSSTVNRRCSDDALSPPRPAPGASDSSMMDEFEREHGSELTFVLDSFHLSEPARRPYMPYIY